MGPIKDDTVKKKEEPVQINNDSDAVSDKEGLTTNDSEDPIWDLNSLFYPEKNNTEELVNNPVVNPASIANMLKNKAKEAKSAGLSKEGLALFGTFVGKNIKSPGESLSEELKLLVEASKTKNLSESDLEIISKLYNPVGTDVENVPKNTAKAETQSSSPDLDDSLEDLNSLFYPEEATEPIPEPVSIAEQLRTKAKEAKTSGLSKDGLKLFGKAVAKNIKTPGTSLREELKLIHAEAKTNNLRESDILTIGNILNPNVSQLEKLRQKAVEQGFSAGELALIDQLLSNASEDYTEFDLMKDLARVKTVMGFSGLEGEKTDLINTAALDATGISTEAFSTKLKFIEILKNLRTKLKTELGIEPSVAADIQEKKIAEKEEKEKALSTGTYREWIETHKDESLDDAFQHWLDNEGGYHTIKADLNRWMKRTTARKLKHSGLKLDLDKDEIKDIIHETEEGKIEAHFEGSYKRLQYYELVIEKATDKTKGGKGANSEEGDLFETEMHKLVKSMFINWQIMHVYLDDSKSKLVPMPAKERQVLAHEPPLSANIPLLKILIQNQQKKLTEYGMEEKEAKKLPEKVKLLGVMLQQIDFLQDKIESEIKSKNTTGK